MRQKVNYNFSTSWIRFNCKEISLRGIWVKLSLNWFHECEKHILIINIGLSDTSRQIICNHHFGWNILSDRIVFCWHCLFWATLESPMISNHFNCNFSRFLKFKTIGLYILWYSKPCNMTHAIKAKFIYTCKSSNYTCQFMSNPVFLIYFHIIFLYL